MTDGFRAQSHCQSCVYTDNCGAVSNNQCPAPCVAEDGRGVQLGAARALPGQGGGLHAPAARGQSAEAGGQPRGEVGGAQSLK